MRSPAVCFLTMVLLGGAGHAQGAISATEILANWTKMESPISETNNTVWSAVDGLVVSSPDHSGSLISDFSVAGDFTFTGTMEAPGDNDTMGLMFGFQDIHNHYRLSFSGGGTQEQYGLTVVRELSGSDTYLASDSGLTWVAGMLYDFSIAREGNNLTINVSHGGTSLFDRTVANTTFTSGRVGFHVYGQTAEYGNIEVVPEPGGLFAWALLGLALAAGRASFPRRRARRAAPATE
jgi:hypothetical protein